ncbi:unnamed protein product [Rhizopus microsporus]
MAAERATLVLGGAAVGAISFAAYQKFTQKPMKPLQPAVMPPPPSQQRPMAPSNNKALDNIEKAKTILPFAFPGPVNDLYTEVPMLLHTTVVTRGDDVDRQKSNFKEDDGVPPQFRAKLADYFRSGFDRGHMVPAADVKNSQVSMDETFYLTNIAPQVGEGFNRDYWAYLENFCRTLTQKFSDVYVFTGPLYLPHQEADGKFYVKYQVIGNPPNVAVPTHFYKVIMTHKNGRYSVGAFVLPNAPIPDNTPLEAFKVPLDAVERGAGLVFFERMGDSKYALPDLCKETECKLVVRKFNDAQKKALPSH